MTDFIDLGYEVTTRKLLRNPSSQDRTFFLLAMKNTNLDILRDEIRSKKSGSVTINQK